MRDNYYDLEQAKMRLQGGVIQYNGTYVYVTRVEREGGEYSIQYERLQKDVGYSGRGDSWTTLDTNLIDTGNMQLGFSTGPDTPRYLMRTPTRQWKEGLAFDNMCFTQPGSNSAYVNRGVPRDTLSGRVLLPIFENNYPSFDEVKKEATQAKESSWFPFDRNYALSGGGDINYKGVCNVGIVKGEQVVLKDEYLFLQESLQEIGVV